MVAPKTPANALLFETSPIDRLAFAAAGVTMAGLAALAAWIPARHAGSADPAVLLRAE